ncbi:hypothetical protein ELI44_37200 [Rhizobium ruizarguesonis]|uniref:hypothetical protein n=1 Tax=Rhizobium ruizarguesonis TaxID=2081791 RepID=UPI0010321EF5|nr:hypothetical protein [Rhizobium ruizarguesonis]TAU35381.1 hypothetical protein ELI42_37225 [Rhizobium ruizarguesonis]TAU45865.1 hypothetical protein ELI44_37200 [Rhizobium ruizarguesonis]
MSLQLVSRRLPDTSNACLAELFTRLSVAIYALALLAIMAGCSVQLSPEYDKITFSNLSALNVKAETLFASLSAGGTAANFSNYQDTYAELIGGFSAARIATLNRQTPPLSAKLLTSPTLKTACANDPASCVNPTPYNLQQVIALLTSMRDTHKRGKLVGELVVGFNGGGGFKGQYEIEMGRVLAFESALQRSEGSNGS